MLVDLLSNIASQIDTSTVVLFFVVAYLTWKFYHGYNLPPGPWGMPVLGYLPFMPKGNPEEIFNEFSKKYGNVMSFQFGPTLAVILNDYEAIKEAYVKQGDNFSGRPQDNLKFDDDDAGVFVQDGEPWRDHRRFILSTLRDYGMGKLSLEPRIMEEVHFFLDELAKPKGRPFDLQSILGMSTANIISTLEFGKRFDYKDPRYIRLRKMQDDVLDLFTSVNPRQFFRFIDYIPFTEPFTHTKHIRQINDDTKEFIKDMITEHRSDYSDNSKKDLIDAIITETNSIIKKTGNEGYFNDDEVVGTLLGLFQAGTETTTTTLRWALLFLMLYPEIQKKVQSEIDDVIGLERDPTMSDKSKMPYTEAVLLEVQRVGSLVPLNVPHANHEETEVGGYRIPKRSMIMTNLWAVHNDPQLWDQPEKFMPERFINKEGKAEKPEYLIPFGIGKRACVGESLARMELFLYFTSMLQRFSFESPKGVTPRLDVETTVVRRPKPYEVCAIQRAEYSS